MLVAVGGIACKREPACSELLLERATSPLPSSWSMLGVSIGPSAVVCDVPTERLLHLVEPSNESADARIRRLEGELAAHGWIAEPGSPRREAGGEVVAKMRRGGQLLVFNVHPTEPKWLRDPALGAHFALSAATPQSPAPPPSAGPSP